MFVSALAGRAKAPAPLSTDEVQLTRTECYGTCPVYTVTIRGDGSVVFEGQASVAATSSANPSTRPVSVSPLQQGNF